MNLGNLGRHTFAAPLAAFALIAGGGIALAASGGSDPAPQAVEHRPAAKPTVKPTVEPTEDPTDEPDSDASPSPSLTGLCKAYQAGGYASSTKNGHVNPAWSALQSAAGGADDVDSYCEDRLAADAAAKAERKGVDDLDEPKADKPAKGPKPAKAHDGDDDDAFDNDDADEVEADDDDAGDVDAGDSDDGDSDDQGDNGSRGSGHSKD